VQAVDLVRVRTELYQALLARAVGAGADACLYATERGLEPLLAVYRTTCLPAVSSAVAAGERRLIAFHEGYGDLNIVSVRRRELPPELRAGEPARNVNSPADFLHEGGGLP
jgi:molybdopterin-guanine dinucleotide biosynthesis protein A